MRTGLFLAIAVIPLAAAAAPAADPPVVFQVQPVGRLLSDARATVRLVGGENAVAGFNTLLRRRLGERGFEGLDISRPILGYVLIPDNPADTVAVVALPVTTEAGFLDLCERANRSKPTRVADGTHELPSLVPGLVARCRFAHGYAYIATAAKDPGPALAPDAVVPPHHLLDPAEQSLAVARLHFDRLPPGLREKATEALTKLSGFGFDGILRGLEDASKPVFDELVRLAKRWVKLSGEAKEAAVRVTLDTRTGELAVEATLTALPGTPLEADIAARKPTTNKFAGLITPDTAAGFKLRLPLFNDELKAAATKGLEQIRANIPAGGQDLAAVLNELFAGLTRTVKAGEFDVVGVIRGPDKKGYFTGVAVVAFDDPSALEKVFRKYVESLPVADEFRTHVTWNVAKVGTVNVHLYKLTDRFFLSPDGPVFGDDPAAAFAFAPNGIFVTLGPDPVAVMKDALAVKPTESPVLDVLVNPARLRKFGGVAGGPEGEADVIRVVGTENRLLSALALTVDGGKELKVRFTLNLTLFPRWAIVSGLDLPPEKK